MISVCLKELYDFDLTVLDEAFEFPAKVLGDYTNTGSNSKMFNSRIRDRICDLSKRWQQRSPQRNL